MKEVEIMGEKETTGKCARCGNPIREGTIGFCLKCFEKKYHYTPTTASRNY